MCGEGREYESLMEDCPTIIMDEVEIVEESNQIGSLITKHCHTEPKVVTEPVQVLIVSKVTISPVVGQEKSVVTFQMLLFFPHVKQFPGGLLQMSKSSAPLLCKKLT